VPSAALSIPFFFFVHSSNKKKQSHRTHTFVTAVDPLASEEYPNRNALLTERLETERISLDDVDDVHR